MGNTWLLCLTPTLVALELSWVALGFDNHARFFLLLSKPQPKPQLNLILGLGLTWLSFCTPHHHHQPTWTLLLPEIMVLGEKFICSIWGGEVIKKMFLTQKFFDWNFFWSKNFFDLKKISLTQKNFYPRNFIPPNFFDIKFFYPKFFWLKNFSYTKDFFYPKMFLTQNFFWPSISSQHSFWQIIFSPKIIFDQLFLIKIFDYIFNNQNNLTSNEMDFDTIKINLVFV